MKTVDFWYFVKKGMIAYAIVFVIQQFIHNRIWWASSSPWAEKGHIVCVYLRKHGRSPILEFKMDRGEIPWLEKIFNWCYITPEY